VRRDALPARPPGHPPPVPDQVARELEALRGEDGLRRRQAARALGQLGDARAVEPLLEALEARREAEAAEALGRLGDIRAVEPLIDVLRESDWSQSRVSAAGALGRLRDARAVPALVAALHDQWGEVRSAAAEALGEIGAASAVEPVCRALRDRYAGVRASAAWALGLLGTVDAVQPLIETLHDPSDYVRMEAAQALGRLGSPEALPALRARCRLLVGETHREVWAAVRLAIQQIKRASSPVRGLPRGLAVEIAAQALPREPEAPPPTPAHCPTLRGKVDGPGADPRPTGALFRLHRTDDPEQRLRAVEALGRSHHPRTVDSLCESLADPDPRVRAAASEGLIQTGWERLPPVLETLAHPDPLVASAGLEVLRKLGWRPASAGWRAWSAIVRRDPPALAAEGLDGMEVLLEALWEQETWARDLDERATSTGDEALLREYRARAARARQELHSLAVEALPRVGSTAVAPLCRALRHPGRGVRLAAAEALGAIADREAIPDLRARARRLGGEFDGEVRAALSAAIARIESRSVDSRALPREGCTGAGPEGLPRAAPE
jgi:HEAT repeat protein